jgi:very-long-chain (3R)-3-hydroxyacyl-CoA dehydratase
MAFTSMYLAAYNGLSFLLWAYLMFRAVSLALPLSAENRLHELYDTILFPFLAGTQSLAALEVIHAATGLVRASPTTTALQVLGKNLVVWTVMVPFPELIIGRDGHGASGIWGFLGCVVFWGLSELIRYGYFAVMLTAGDVPAWLKWLR